MFYSSENSSWKTTLQSPTLIQANLPSPRLMSDKLKNEPTATSPLSRGPPLSAPAGSYRIKNEEQNQGTGFVQITSIQPFPLAPTPAQLGKAPLQRRLSMGM